ncbi:CLUMA_CG021320, isoform A [Clunio marinus]|uniref:CLUMA_CG021320, isoform A n=1 Tax=Clunio marinus TaxID=568069 RepID=A0A1J1J8B0_9DIPT|nr:CLUMA_CG021320, isoform A [Clunio marinus]
MSQSSDLQRIHVLNLPDEIFLNIFSYINFSSRKKVSRVCRRFYELMCVVRQDCHPLELSRSQICDEEIRSSIVNSSRKFEDLTIYRNSPTISISKMEMNAIENSFKLLESDLRRIFDCIPNVENLTLDCIAVNIDTNENNSELNLYKLKKLTIMDSSNCLNILNRLPKDTLKEAIMMSTHEEEIRFQQFFNQQTNIKMLELSENSQVNFDHLRLEHLKLYPCINCINHSNILRHQPRLRYIDFSNCLIDDDTFTAICELRNLEVAKMRVDLGLPCRVFESLKNLTHLKELQLKSDQIHECNHLLELSRMHLKIEKLKLLYEEEKILPEFFIQLSQHFRNLKQVTIANRSISTINTILEHFPNLESIIFNCDSWSPEEDILVISENLRHEKLKEIIVTHIFDDSADITRSLLTLLNVCPNLERIMLSQLVEVYYEDLQQIINDHSKLTHLSLEFDTFDFEDGIIDLIRTAASRLQFIELEGLFSSADFQTESSLKDLFEDEFTYISYSDYGYDDFIYDGTLTMKKRNVSKWYRDLNM